jgi:glycosyltransferase involved in cell wall biosynthesis
VKLSIVIPVYGAEARLADTVKHALAVEYGCDLELLVAHRGAPAAVSALAGVDDPRVRVIEADDDPLRAAAAVATGDYLVALDADLRYDPEDIPRLLEPVRAGHTTVVYGSRLFGSHSGDSFWYVVGNKALTTAANIIFNCYLSDLETGYKLMPVTLYRSLPRLPHGAVGDAAVTGTLLRRGVRPFEIPVSFHAGSRPVSERAARRSPPRRRGRALLILLRERFRRRRPRSPMIM